MKTSRFSIILGIVFLAGAAIVTSGVAPVGEAPRESFSVKDLPPIELGKCLGVQKLIARNPLSRLLNDFLLVIKYEEKQDRGGALKEGMTPGRALNVYLVHGFLVPENQKAGIIHDTVLVVQVTTTDAESSLETVREWILIDDDGDRNVDRGVFRETATGGGRGADGSKEIGFPTDRLQELQAYYEEAAVALDARAGKGPAEGCVLS